MVRDRFEAIRNLMDLICGLSDEFTVSTDTIDAYEMKDIILALCYQIDVEVDRADLLLVNIPKLDLSLSFKTENNRTEISINY